tara:strand:- start:131 stop:382 length:252 start_codon:yes stop_codon:yes gene_type:complete
MPRISRRKAIQAGTASAFAFNFFPARVFGANDRIAGPYTEVVLLGNLAIRANEPVEWSPEKGQAKSDKANGFVRRKYRKEWEW